MKDIESKKEFEFSLKVAIDDTEKKIVLYPSMYAYQVILGQLMIIKNILINENRLPSYDEREQITMGNIALKNFKDEEPEYANRLMDLGYQFYYYEELPG